MGLHAVGVQGGQAAVDRGGGHDVGVSPDRGSTGVGN